MAEQSAQGQPVQPMDKDLLRNIPMFAGLPDAEREDLARLLQSRSFAAQQPMFWVGDGGSDMFIVQRGDVRLSYPDEAGAEITLAVLGPGAFFGELSLLDGGPRTATARAETDATLLVLDRQHFYRFLEKTPSAAVHIIATLAQRQREALDKLRGIRNVNQEVDQRRTRLQTLVDRAAAIGASGWFLLGNIGFFMIWIIVQTVLALRYHRGRIIFPVDDPPTFFWLGFMVTMEAILLTMFVLNSQRRQAERDRIRGDLDYQVNLKAHLEIMQLHQKLDRLAGMLAEREGRTGAGR